MDEIRELLQNLTQLSAEDLERLRGLIVTEADRLDTDEATVEEIAMLGELADAGEQVMADQGRRQAEHAQAQSDRQAARERIAAINAPEEDPEAETTEPVAEETEDPEAEAETTEVAPEPVAASGSRVARMAARQKLPKPNPETAASTENRTALVATGEMRNAPAGTELDRERLAEAMVATLSRLPAPAGPAGSRGRDVVVAYANWANQYPDDRRVTGEFEHDSRIMRQAVGTDALVATGGICSPVDVDWSIGTIATADRPLQAAFPSFNAGRGGLIYRSDFDLGGYASATGIWTEATDANPAGATKPILTVSCPSTETVYVEAVTTRVGFGNMQARFDPETVAATTDSVMAAYARVAENNLLNLLAAQCTQGVTNTQILGATRDLQATLGQLVAAFRNLHRVPRTTALRAIFPDWMKELIRIDLARETAHQQDGQWNSLMITDQQIQDLFTPYGVSPIWHLDGQASGVQGVAVNQFFSTQSTGAVNVFPTSVTWYLYYEGSVQYLDGGRLDLGIVRDSLLDATNDFETFVEVFETLAFRGFSGGALQLNTTLCASGGSAGTINTSASCP